jgi:hypothetical protein
MIVCLTIRYDWPGCRVLLTYGFATLRRKPNSESSFRTQVLTHEFTSRKQEILFLVKPMV